MKKVYVGLSGGVDSGTSAALLKSRGYDVTGIFIKIWQPEFIECTWREDRLDAMRVCAALSIPFREIDLSERYKKDVVDAMVADYRKGITPNPDVLCNEKIKFGAFMQWALADGADMVATGHYARTRLSYKSSPCTELVRGLDAAKDQSYFLYRLSSKDLARIIFPIGGMHKSDVREAARGFGLPIAEKPDSQGLCFVGDVSMRDFLRRFISVKSGMVLDMRGAVIGEHDGAALYTIGQRHGFTLVNGPADGAHYIVAIDTDKNTLTVSSYRFNAARARIQLRDVHWIDTAPVFPFSASMQTRYHETPIPAEILRSGNDVSCTFEKPHIAGPGQSLVIYNGDICIGGGIICA